MKQNFKTFSFKNTQQNEEEESQFDQQDKSTKKKQPQSASAYKKTKYQKFIGYTKWQRRFRERDQFREEYDIPDGDIRNGSEIFFRSCCANCHSVEGEPNDALPLEIIYRFKGMIQRRRFVQCSYEWNRNRLYSLLWDPNEYFKTDFMLDPIEDSQERADIAEFIMHLKYSIHKPQTWHDDYDD